MKLRWSRSFGPFEGFVKVYSGCETKPSSSVWYLIIDDDELWESCGLMSESAKRGGEPREGVRGRDGGIGLEIPFGAVAVFSRGSST